MIKTSPNPITNVKDVSKKLTKVKQNNALHAVFKNIKTGKKAIVVYYPLAEGYVSWIPPEDFWIRKSNRELVKKLMENGYIFLEINYEWEKTLKRLIKGKRLSIEEGKSLIVYTYSLIIERAVINRIMKKENPLDVGVEYPIAGLILSGKITGLKANAVCFKCGSPLVLHFKPGNTPLVCELRCKCEKSLFEIHKSISGIAEFLRNTKLPLQPFTKDKAEWAIVHKVAKDFLGPDNRHQQL